MTDNDKDNVNKEDAAFKDRLANFGVNVDSFENERKGVPKDWEPLEGDYEIPTLSGNSVDYSANIPNSNNSLGPSSISPTIFSRMKMTELYVCGSGTGQQYDGLFNYKGNTINKVNSFTNSAYIANTVVKTKACDINGDAHEDLVIASFDRSKKYNNSVCTFIQS